jgi:hypothetical protein
VTIDPASPSMGTMPSELEALEHAVDYGEWGRGVSDGVKGGPTCGRGP